MNIGIDINPTIDSVIGKGYYIKSIFKALSDIDKRNTYYLYGSENPSYSLSDNFIFKRIKGKPSFLWDLKCVVSSILREKVDVFLSVKSFYSAILHPKSVLLIHDIGVLKNPEFYPKKKAESFRRLFHISLKRVKKIITPSSYTKSFIVNRYNISHSKILKISGAVPEWTRREATDSSIERVKNKYNLPKNYFLFVGTLEPRKNLKRLIESFAEFKKDDKKRFKLIIVGKKGFKHEEIFKSVIDNGLSHDVVFTGHIPESDMKPIYTLAYAFVLPSIIEGFGLSALEAMACKLPLICSSKGALGETSHRACLEIDPLDVKSIEKALRNIVKNKELRDELIKKGYNRTKKFSWEKSARKMLDVFMSFKSKD